MSKIESQLMPHQRLVHYSYVTLPHDNIATLVQRFGSPPEWILQTNKMKKPEDIRPGQRLKIPVAVPFVRSIWARGRRIQVVTDKPYGSKQARAGGLIHLSAVDRPDGQDEMQFLHATWPDPRDKALYTLECLGLRGNRRDGGAYGGVGIQVPLHGRSGAGNESVAETTAVAAIWGWGRVFRNGKLVADKAPVHASITGSGADASHVLDLIAEAQGLPGGFAHLQARTVDLCLSD